MGTAARRRTRAEQVESNRSLVLDTAFQVFRRDGYGLATLDRIAQEAGFSKGVVYSQFSSKADLFLAVLERRIKERADQQLDLLTRPDDGVWQSIVAAIGTTRQDREWALAVIEFRLVAARNPELQHRYTEVHRRTITGLTRVIDSWLTRADLTPSLPTPVLAEAIFALDQGLILEDLCREPLPTASQARLYLQTVTGVLPPTIDQPTIDQPTIGQPPRGTA